MRFLGGQESVRQAVKIILIDHGIDIKNADQYLVLIDPLRIDYSGFSFFRGPGLIRSLAFDLALSAVRMHGHKEIAEKRAEFLSGPLGPFEPVRSGPFLRA